MKKEEWKLYQRQKLLADWYGSDYAFTEMAVHTPRMRSIEEELDAFWGKAAGAEVMEMNTIRQNWHYIVGEKLAEHSQVIRRENSKLFVSVDHPAWQMELRRMKNLLCKRVNEYTGNEKITDLVFVSKRVSS